MRSAASGMKTSRVFGQRSERLPCRATRAPRAPRRRPGRSAGRRAGSPDDQADRQGHDQRVDAEDADADAVTEAGEHRGDERQRDGDDRADGRDWVAMTKALIVATIPTDRSMPPVSIVRVCHAARIASGMADRTVTRPSSLDDARPDDLERDDEQDEQPDQRDERPVAQERAATPPSGQPGRSPAGRRRLAPVIAGVLRRASEAPSMTTPTMIRPWTTRQVRVDDEERQVRPDRGPG